jgi:hypothetical protein
LLRETLLPLAELFLPFQPLLGRGLAAKPSPRRIFRRLPRRGIPRAAGHWLLGNLQQWRNQQKQHPTQRHGLEKHVHRLHTLRGDTLRTPAGNIRSTAEADVHKCRSGQTSPATSGDGSRGLGSCRCTCASQQEKGAILTGISGISAYRASALAGCPPPALPQHSVAPPGSGQACNPHD